MYQKKVDELGFEPKTFRMRSEHSTPELHAHDFSPRYFSYLASICGLFINERYMNIPAEISLPAIRTLRSELQNPVDYWIIHAKLRLHKSDSNTVYYVNGEEEIFEQHAIVTVDYHPSQSGAGGDWTHRRRIMCVPTTKLDQVCSDIEQRLKQ